MKYRIKIISIVHREGLIEKENIEDNIEDAIRDVRWKEAYKISEKIKSVEVKEEK
jgi:hypothetical protein